MFIEKFRSIRAQSAANRKIPIYRSTAPRIKGNKNALLVLTLGAIFIGVLNISGVRAEGDSAVDQGIMLAQSAPSEQGARGNRPPREALDACKSAKSQSACSFKDRDGGAVQGKCMSPKSDVPLACVPADGPKKG
ncbi:hypothetical protein [Antarcticimicrobium sediminis]|uniref:Uncharacterized protein n=1 Tax=Antarcticimicrobium sediminis TaxID=2546227 RepID=A0A4R5EPL2_9RHOB|nr:hypothetical protein [Antarcticimicrobium sediminis]TDE36588.1 hypothetical protein E1B25_13800 [Antarcticimicrobium sediminis]